MSRVLLFVQNDPAAKPRCFTGVARAGESSGWVEGDGSGFVYSRAALNKKNASRRWWLVECENAEAGRQLIAVAELGLPGGVMQLSARPGDTTLLCTGRILASSSTPSETEGGGA